MHLEALSEDEEFLNRLWDVLNSNDDNVPNISEDMARLKFLLISYDVPLQNVAEGYDAEDVLASWNERFNISLRSILSTTSRDALLQYGSSESMNLDREMEPAPQDNSDILSDSSGTQNDAEEAKTLLDLYAAHLIHNHEAWPKLLRTIIMVAERFEQSEGERILTNLLNPFMVLKENIDGMEGNDGAEEVVLTPTANCGVRVLAGEGDVTALQEYLIGYMELYLQECQRESTHSLESLYLYSKCYHNNHWNCLLGELKGCKDTTSMMECLKNYGVIVYEVCERERLTHAFCRFSESGSEWMVEDLLEYMQYDADLEYALTIEIHGVAYAASQKIQWEDGLNVSSNSIPRSFPSLTTMVQSYLIEGIGVNQPQKKGLLVELMIQYHYPWATFLSMLESLNTTQFVALGLQNPFPYGYLVIQNVINGLREKPERTEKESQMLKEWAAGERVLSATLHQIVPDAGPSESPAVQSRKRSYEEAELGV